jgi:hypothetical protein
MFECASMEAAKEALAGLLFVKLEQRASLPCVASDQADVVWLITHGNF